MRTPAAAACLLLALAGAPAARAAETAAPDSAPPLGHRAWNAESGLPQNSVQAILQTNDGFLWIATQSGLARFDGIRFQVFEPATAPGLPDLDIRCLAQSRDGTLWIGTFSGLANGATFVPAGSYQFQIFYNGGDGNDVVLSYVGCVTDFSGPTVTPPAGATVTQTFCQ